MKNILVIEDTEQNMYLIEFILKKHGYNVLKAMNGKDGLKIAVENKPDLIVMDWDLPDINGIDITIELRKNVNFKDTPIIFCSSNVMRGDKEKAFSAGCTDYLEKPIDPKSFASTIKKYLPD